MLGWPLSSVTIDTLTVTVAEVSPSELFRRQRK